MLGKRQLERACREQVCFLLLPESQSESVFWRLGRGQMEFVPAWSWCDGDRITRRAFERDVVVAWQCTPNISIDG